MAAWRAPPAHDDANVHLVGAVVDFDRRSVGSGGTPVADTIDITAIPMVESLALNDSDAAFSDTDLLVSASFTQARRAVRRQSAHNVPMAALTAPGGSSVASSASFSASHARRTRDITPKKSIVKL